MNRLFGSAVAYPLVAILALPAASPTSAATGDTLRVVGERVNLRAGPSDDANVRSQIVQGEQLLVARRRHLVPAACDPSREPLPG